MSHSPPAVSIVVNGNGNGHGSAAANSSADADSSSSGLIHHAPRSSVFESFSTTVKCIIGSGIMSLPYAFLQSGVLLGILFLTLISLLSYSTMSLIIEAAHLTRGRLRRRKRISEAHAASRRGSPMPDASYGAINGAQTPAVGEQAIDPLDLSVIVADPDMDVIGYQQIAYVCYGEWGRISADSVLIFTQVGSCAAFLVLVLTNLQACLASYGHHWALSEIALFIAPIVLGLSLPRSTTYLAPAAHVGNLSLLVGISTIFYFGVTSPTSRLELVHRQGFQHLWNLLTELPAYSGRPFGILLFFGISAFAFAAHCEVVAVEADAQSPKVYRYVLPAAIFVIGVIYITVGIFAYACFGPKTEANILLNLGTSFFVNLVRVALSCTLLVNFCLALFPATQTLDLLIAGPAPVSRDLPHQHEITPRSRSTPSEGLSKSNSLTETTSLLQPKPARSSQPQWPLSASRNVSSNQLDVPTPEMSPDSPNPVLFADYDAELKQYHRKGNMIRIGAVLFTFAIGLLIQDLGVLFSLVGSVAGGILCFTMPPVFYFKISRLEHHKITNGKLTSLLIQAISGALLVIIGLFVVGFDASQDV